MDEFNKARRKKSKNICANKEDKKDVKKGNKRARREIQREDEKSISEEDNRDPFECDDETKYTLLDHPFDRESGGV